MQIYREFPLRIRAGVQLGRPANHHLQDLVAVQRRKLQQPSDRKDRSDRVSTVVGAACVALFIACMGGIAALAY